MGVIFQRCMINRKMLGMMRWGSSSSWRSRESYWGTFRWMAELGHLSVHYEGRDVQLTVSKSRSSLFPGTSLPWRSHSVMYLALGVTWWRQEVLALWHLPSGSSADAPSFHPAHFCCPQSQLSAEGCATPWENFALHPPLGKPPRPTLVFGFGMTWTGERTRFWLQSRRGSWL